jgi:hypothetical protein
MRPKKPRKATHVVQGLTATQALTSGTNRNAAETPSVHSIISVTRLKTRWMNALRERRELELLDESGK